jgi:hypothetical protein
MNWWRGSESRPPTLFLVPISPRRTWVSLIFVCVAQPTGREFLQPRHSACFVAHPPRIENTKCLQNGHRQSRISGLSTPNSEA